MATVKDGVRGKWLQDALDSLDVSVSDVATQMGLTSSRRLYYHLRDKSHLSARYLIALKAALPRINLNYVVAGEFPILVHSGSQAELLHSSMQLIRDTAERALATTL